jgi:ribose transport system ATP-binding protein
MANPTLHVNPSEARQRGVGMIYQELSIAPHLSVTENIFLGIESRKGLLIDSGKMQAEAKKTLVSLGHDGIDVNQPAGELSVSQQQIVEIARALSMGCKIIVFDEPTSSLAQADVARLFDLIDTLAKRGLTIIYISHFLEEVRRLTSRLTILRDGASVAVYETKAVDDAKIVAEMVGRAVKDLYPRSARKTGEVVLEADVPGRGKITLRRGEVVGLCGLVGAGRTEFLRAIFGLDTVEGKNIVVHRSQSTSDPRSNWQAHLGLVSENRKEEGLALDLSIGDNICLPSLSKLGKAGFISPGERSEHTVRWISNFGIRCQGPNQSIGNLSGGNQQKAAIARLLEADCDILLLDEPTRGIDIAAKAKIYEVINQLVTDPKNPKAVLMVSSYLPELLGVCDRIATVCRGQLSEAEPVGQTNSEKLMRAATGN